MSLSDFGNFKFVFFDLETTSLDTFEAHILEIAVLDRYGQPLLHRYVKHPETVEITNSHIHGITHEKINSSNPKLLDEVFEELELKIVEKYGSSSVYFLAYNNFYYDQLVLESSYKRRQRVMPNNWLFMDLYPQFRELIPEKLKSYKLTKVYEYCFGVPLEGAHNALEDTQGMYRIFLYIVNKYCFHPSANQFIHNSYTNEAIGEIGEDNLKVSFYLGYLYLSKNLWQYNSFHPKSIYQKIEILELPSYYIYKLKSQGIDELKDLIIYFLVDYRNFNWLLTNRFGIKSKWHIERLTNRLKHLAYILYNMSLESNLEKFKEQKDKIKIF